LKKILLILASILIAQNAFAMKPMNNADLSQVAGRSGISINVDVTMNVHFDVLAWGDSDGLGAVNIWNEETTGGYIGVTGFTMQNLSISHRTGSSSSNSVSLWPESSSINIHNGVPYYRVHVGSD